MMSEEDFKKKMIDRLNSKNKGWKDGDRDGGVEKKVDILNDNLRIAIEVKDDRNYHLPTSRSGEVVSGGMDLRQKNRQFKDDAKDANRKFTNYLGYKTLLIIRTDVAFSSNSEYLIDLILSGPVNINLNSGITEQPSAFWGAHDNSISEVGGFLFIGQQLIYIKNININMNRDRVMSKEEIQDILGFRVL